MWSGGDRRRRHVCENVYYIIIFIIEAKQILDKRAEMRVKTQIRESASAPPPQHILYIHFIWMFSVDRHARTAQRLYYRFPAASRCQQIRNAENATPSVVVVVEGVVLHCA